MLESKGILLQRMPYARLPMERSVNRYGEMVLAGSVLYEKQADSKNSSYNAFFPGAVRLQQEWSGKGH